MSSCVNFRVFRFLAASSPFFFTNAEEAVEGTVVLAVQTDLIAAHVRVALRVLLGKRTDGKHGLGGSVFFRGGFGLAILFVGDGGGFEGPETEQTPAGVGEGFDKVVFVGGGWFEFRDERGDEIEETLAGLAGEQDGGGEETVSYGVAGGVILSARGFWPAGFLCVSPVGG